MKLCKDCKYGRRAWVWLREFPECHHDKAVLSMNVFTGKGLHQKCSRMRNNEGICKPETILFEPKEKK